MKKLVVSVSTFLLISISSFAQKSEVYTTSDGAIHGYDPVAYFKDHKPVKGDKKYALSYKSANWYFANQEDMNLFKANPAMYAPQYGGYCAYGLAQGYKATTEPDAWLISDGKLYLNYNKDVQSKWKEKQTQYIQTADKNWPGVKDKE